uniref:Golgi apparatus protein 1 n=1 Tax=Gongylonema pulchrum TaxID=637853 RepID=A0A183D5U9_9BILA
LLRLSRFEICNELHSFDHTIIQLLCNLDSSRCSITLSEYLNEEIDHGDVLECLLDHKDRPEMTPKCRSYVNHFELITLRDFQFDERFAQFCSRDIKKYCMEVSTDKAEIIRCLSTVMFEHKVLGTPDDLEKDCKKHLKTAYLHQEQSIVIFK